MSNLETWGHKEHNNRDGCGTYVHGHDLHGDCCWEQCVHCEWRCRESCGSQAFFSHKAQNTYWALIKEKRDLEERESKNTHWSSPMEDGPRT